MEFQFWQVLLLTTLPPALAGSVTWLLNRRAARARAQVENDSTAVDTITDVLAELRTELTRAREEVSVARAEASEAATTLRRLTASLDNAARSMAAHREWDDARVLEGAPEPPALPVIPHWWEIMRRTYRIPDAGTE